MYMTFVPGSRNGRNGVGPVDCPDYNYNGDYKRKNPIAQPSCIVPLPTQYEEEQDYLMGLEDETTMVPDLTYTPDAESSRPSRRRRYVMGSDSDSE